MPDQAAVGILTRAPEPGRTKTRIARAIGDAAAAALAAAMLQDTVEAVAGEGWRTTLFVEPPEAVEAVRRLTERTAVRAQASGDIGARMRAAAEVLLAGACAPVVLVGSDIPGLERTQIEAALSALRSPQAPDVILGPATDGGYYLLGLRQLRAHREAALFGPSIAWGTGTVLAESRALAAAAGLRVGRVAAQGDIDTVADLVRLRARLAGPHTDARIAGPRTRAIVASLDLDGCGPPTG